MWRVSGMFLTFLVLKHCNEKGQPLLLLERSIGFDSIDIYWEWSSWKEKGCSKTQVRMRLWHGQAAPCCLIFVLSVEAPCLNADFCLCIMNQSSLNCIVAGEFRNKLGFLTFFVQVEILLQFLRLLFLGWWEFSSKGWWWIIFIISLHFKESGNGRVFN